MNHLLLLAYPPQPTPHAITTRKLAVQLHYQQNTRQSANYAIMSSDSPLNRQITWRVHPQLLPSPVPGQERLPLFRKICSTHFHMGRLPSHLANAWSHAPNRRCGRYGPYGFE